MKTFNLISKDDGEPFSYKLVIARYTILFSRLKQHRVYYSNSLDDLKYIALKYKNRFPLMYELSIYDPFGEVVYY